MALSLKETLTKTLIEKGLLTQDKLQEALKVQEQKGGDLKNVLVELGFVTKEDIISVLSLELGIPPINLSRFKITPDVLKLIPKKVAQQHHVIAVSKLEDVLTVAMEDPLNIFALDSISTLTRFKIIPVLAFKKDIEDAIHEYYEESAYDEIEKVVGSMAASKVEIVEGARREPLDKAEMIKSTTEAPVVKLTNQLITEAVRSRASDILIEPLEKQTRVRYRIDGVLRHIQTFPKDIHDAVISRLKIMSNLNIAEQRLPQDGRFKMNVLNREVDFRISVLPSIIGEKTALRILDKSVAMLDIEKLGFNKKTLADLKNASERPHGMILICGPTGSGKTTTLYSLLKLVASPEDNVVTVEDPIEYQLEGLNQVAARPEMGLTFASALRSILRQDPDIIMIGEIRDLETADISIKSALTGHLMLTTLHTTTATGALVRLINIGIEPFLIASSVILTASQRLVRRICPDCKESYELDKASRERLEIKEKDKIILFRGKGCKTCLKRGYKGQIALMETLPVTPHIRQLISGKANEQDIRKEARREGMINLREDGLQKAIEGITTLEEVLRVTAGEQDIETKDV